MKTKFKSKRQKTDHYQFFGVVTITLIFLVTLFFINRFNKRITPNLLEIASASIDKLNETILMNYRVGDTFRKVDLENAIQYTKNKNDEIIGVDFKLEEVYKALGLVSAYLHKSLETPEIRETILKYYQKDMSSRLGNIILSVPVGVASSNLYFANLGPRVPVRISYMGYIGASVRLKLENYGINNVLISIFIDCSITNEIIIPTLKNNIQHHYSILVASKLIQGNVPSYYGGTMETKSNILNVPIP